MTGTSQFNKRRQQASQYLWELLDMLTLFAERLRLCHRCMGCKLSVRRITNERREVEGGRDDSSYLGT